MTTNYLSSATAGWIAIASGVSAIFAALFLILMYAVHPSFGRVNDVFNSVIGISSVVLACSLFAAFHDRSPLLSQIALALALVGAIFTVIGSILILFGFTDFVLAGWYSGVGFALIGIWLAGFCLAFLRDAVPVPVSQVQVLPHNLVVFGIVVGAFMAFGLLGVPGIFAGIDSMESMPWYLYLAFFGWLGTFILYPIWAIWLGRHLLLVAQ